MILLYLILLSFGYTRTLFCMQHRQPHEHSRQRPCLQIEHEISKAWRFGQYLSFLQKHHPLVRSAQLIVQQHVCTPVEERKKSDDLPYQTNIH